MRVLFCVGFASWLMRFWWTYSLARGRLRLLLPLGHNVTLVHANGDARLCVL